MTALERLTRDEVEVCSALATFEQRELVPFLDPAWRYSARIADQIYTRRMDTPDRDALFRKLEAVRQSYAALVSSMSESDWERQSRNPDFENRELVWHMAWSMTWLADGAATVRARRRPLLSRLPGGIMDPLRRIAMHRLASKATPERAVQKYEEGHAALLDQLRQVTADDWQLHTVRFGVRRSMLWHFQQPVMHFNEHRSDIELSPGCVAGPGCASVDGHG